MILEGYQVKTVRVWKPRWLDPKTCTTCHSRPPDEMGRISVCALIFFLILQGLLDSAKGVHTYEPALKGLCGRVSPRTIQRWLSRMVPQAPAVMQDCRRAVINRCEPRPVERLFPQGLSPPETIRLKKWKNPDKIAILWQGFTILQRGASECHTPVAILLAEARRRLADEKPQWM